MTIEGPEQPKEKITLAEKVIDLTKYETVPYSAIPLTATTDYLVEKYGIQNPAVVEVGPVPGEYYDSPEPGKKYAWATQHYAFIANPKYKTSEPEPSIRYLADAHPDWKLVALGVHDIPQELKETLLGTHADIYLYDTGNAESNGLNTSASSYYHPEEDVTEWYPKLIKKLGGKRPDIISAQHVFGNTGVLIFDGDEMTVEACALLPIGGFLLVTLAEEDEEETGDLLHSNPKSFPFDMKQNMKLVTIMEFPPRKEESDYGYKPRVLIYRKIGDLINPARLEDMEREKKVRDEWRVEGWKPARED